MGDPFDPQRFKLYAAEAAVFPDRVLLSLSELRAILAGLQAADWFQSNYPHYLTPIPIRNGKGDQWTRIGEDGRSIHMLRKSRAKEVLVHELAHVVCPRGIEDHGCLYAGMLLYMAGKVYGQPTAKRLRYHMRRRGVGYDRRVARFGRVELP
jgi:hypothetical protein